MKIELKKGIFIEGFDDFPDWEILVDLRNDLVGVFEYGLLYQGKTSDITEVFAKDCVELEYFGEYWEGMWEYSGYCNFDINAPYDYVHTAKESILSACSSEYCIIYRNKE